MTIATCGCQRFRRLWGSPAASPQRSGLNLVNGKPAGLDNVANYSGRYLYCVEGYANILSFTLQLASCTTSYNPDFNRHNPVF